MKKLILISVILALVAGPAFSQLALGGYTFGKYDILRGVSPASGTAEIPDAGGGMGRINIEASGATDDGQFGGWVRYRADANTSYKWGNTGGGNGDANVGANGFAYWKPIPQLKVQIGLNHDGVFDTSNITRWGWYSRASDVFISADNAWGNGTDANSDYAIFGGWDGDSGGFGGNGLLVEITPIPELALNFGIPMGEGTADQTYNRMIVQAAGTIPDIGKAFITLQGRGATNDPDPTKTGESLGGKVWIAFSLTAVENLGVDIGGSFSFGHKDDKSAEAIGLALGVSYGADAFQIKARFFAAMGSKDPAGNEIKNNNNEALTQMCFDLLPSYKITDNLTAFLSAGVILNGMVDADKNAVVAWHIEPYITQSIGWDRNFYAGFRLESAGGKDAPTSWSIPIGVVFGF